MKIRAGLTLFLLGLAILGIWNWWVKTRSFAPVDLPIASTGKPNITTQFPVNFDGLYFIEIAAHKGPIDTLHCIMGVQADATRCKDTPSVLAATWTISNDGHQIAQGSSNQLHSLPPETATVSRVIGEFQGRAGQTYELTVTFLNDTSALAPAQPHLRVTVAGIARTDLQSAGVLVFSIAFICALFGMILLLLDLYGKRAATAAGDANHKWP